MAEQWKVMQLREIDSFFVLYTLWRIDWRKIFVFLKGYKSVISLQVFPFKELLFEL